MARDVVVRGGRACGASRYLDKVRGGARARALTPTLSRDGSPVMALTRERIKLTRERIKCTFGRVNGVAFGRVNGVTPLAGIMASTFGRVYGVAFGRVNGVNLWPG